MSSSSLAAQLEVHVRSHKSDGILLDTNVLVLLLLGSFQPGLIGGKRLEKYAIQDAELLANYVGNFSRILTTSHILAETSNLAAQVLTGKWKTDFFTRIFPLFCTDRQDALRQCEVVCGGINDAVFIQLGLTDAAVVAAIDVNRLLLTDDLDLHLAALAKGAHSINFTHMREAAGLL
jgi:hypothetical protein